MDAPNLPKPTPTWALSFPEPRSRPLSMSPDALYELLTTKSATVDFIIVDVRRTDIDVRQFS
jgi:arsenical-resistance protein 2